MRNERIRGTTKVGEISKKVQERTLKLYGPVMQREREELYVGRRVMEMEVQEKRKTGRPKRKWLDRVGGISKRRGLSGDEGVRPSYMEAYIIKHQPHIKVGIRRRGH